jgi:glucose/arabinose dehydrogenase
MSALLPVRPILLTLALLASGLAGGAAATATSATVRPAAGPAATETTTTTVAAAAVPRGFTQRTVLRGLAGGTDMAFAPGGRLFITLKSGMVRFQRSTGTAGTLLNSG